jgi:hypothetical protein
MNRIVVSTTKEGFWNPKSDCIAHTAVHESLKRAPRPLCAFFSGGGTSKTAAKSSRILRLPHVVLLPPYWPHCPLNAFTELCKHTLGCHGRLSKAVHCQSQEPLPDSASGRQRTARKVSSSSFRAPWQSEYKSGLESRAVSVGLIDKASPVLDLQLVFVTSGRALPSLVISIEYQARKRLFERVLVLHRYQILQACRNYARCRPGEYSTSGFRKC